jgi:hypothetical protein
MKRALLAATLTSLLLTMGTVSAQDDKIDCESLAELGGALDMVREGLEAGETVDDATYNDLADVINAMRVIAEAEGNAKLDRALDRLVDAHNDNDRREYIAALRDVNTIWGALYVADCD